MPTSRGRGPSHLHAVRQVQPLAVDQLGAEDQLAGCQQVGRGGRAGQGGHGGGLWGGVWIHGLLGDHQLALEAVVWTGLICSHHRIDVLDICSQRLYNHV